VDVAVEYWEACFLPKHVLEQKINYENDFHFSLKSELDKNMRFLSIVNNQLPETSLCFDSEISYNYSNGSSLDPNLNEVLSKIQE
jgi:hypothetical protein